MQTFTNGKQEGGLYGPFVETGVSYYAPGISATSVVSPADTFAFGDSADTPWYTITIGSILSRYFLTNTTLSSNSQLRHGGHFNYAFTDGHSKSVIVIGGNWTNNAGWGYLSGPIALPSNSSFYGDWCIDPKAILNTDAGQFECDLIAPSILASTQLWPN